MVYDPSYATLYHLRKRGVPVSLLPDDDARELLDDISRWVDDFTDQIFWPKYESLYLDGPAHRYLRHPSLHPILSAQPTVTEYLERTRTAYGTWTTAGTVYTLDTDLYRVETAKVPRKIEHSLGVWNEGSGNYLVTGWWGWLNKRGEATYTLAQNFDGTEDRLYLTSVVGLRPHDTGSLLDPATDADYTILTIVDVDPVNNYVTVDGQDLITLAAVIGDSFIRFGQVPMSVRKFVLESAYVNSGAEDCDGDGGWLKREKTDTYEWERFSPKDMGMQGGEFWTGIPMIDSGIRRYCRPTYIGLV